jgi:hypothetical protein
MSLNGALVFVLLYRRRLSLFSDIPVRTVWNLTFGGCSAIRNNFPARVYWSFSLRSDICMSLAEKQVSDEIHFVIIEADTYGIVTWMQITLK